MSREILFKAKRIDNGEWVEGYYSKSPEPMFAFLKDFIFAPYFDEKTECGYDNGFRIDINTLCQYTGLLDKNGNKIWENDVVKYHFGEDVAPIRFGKYQGCFDSTKTAHIGFYVDWSDKTCLRKDLGYWVKMIDCNVIGNIFDDPELVEMGCE